MENYKEEVKELRHELKKKEAFFESMRKIQEMQEIFFENRENRENLLLLSGSKEKPCKDLKEILRKNLDEFEKDQRKGFLSTEELVNKHLKRRDEEEFNNNLNCNSKIFNNNSRFMFGSPTRSPRFKLGKNK